MLTETITWYAPAERLPDADLTVLVETRGCEEPIWLGALDGEQWRDVEGMPIEVVRWADMPRGSAGVPGTPESKENNRG
jgi:hypothetical protein